MQTRQKSCVRRFSLLLAIIYGGSLIGCSTYPQALNRPTSYDEAVKHADTIVVEFQRDIWWGDFFRKTAGSGIIMMAGAALGLGISGVGGDALKILGFGGATALGLAGYLDTKHADPVKWAGIIAIQCVVTKANQAVGSSQAFNRYYETLSAKTAAFTEATSRLAGYLDSRNAQVKEMPAWRSLNSLRSQSETTSALVHGLLEATHPPAAALFEVGNFVYDSAEGIRARVNSIASKSDPDLGKLQAAMSNLSVYRKQVTGSVSPAKVKGVQDSIASVQAGLSQLTTKGESGTVLRYNYTGSDINTADTPTDEAKQLINDSSVWVLAIADRSEQILNLLTILPTYGTEDGTSRQISIGPNDIKTCIDGLEKDVKVPQIIVAPESPVIVKAQPSTGDAEPTNIFVSGIQGTMKLTPGVEGKIKFEQSDAVGLTKLVKLIALVKEDAQIPVAITDDGGAEKLITVLIKR